MAGRGASPQAVTRFWSNVERGSEEQCWPWTGYSEDGYGRFYIDGRMIGAHELAVTFTTGEERLPGLDTCHTCDNPPCCNPKHLRFDTRQSNVDDMFDRERARVGEAHHAARLSPELVRMIRERRSAGALQRDLAKQYGISAAYVSDIVNGLAWQTAGGPVCGRSKRQKRYPNSRIGKMTSGK